jgi:N-acetylmuramoyl-L-alanine amidase
MALAAKVAELSVSLAAKTELAQTSESAISKPQIIQPTAAVRDIIVYKAKSGDTVQSIAAAHNVTPDTIRWANDLLSDAVEENKQLTIPPIDGVVYTVKQGDTPQSIAATFKADKDRIVSFNDLEIEGTTAGKKIVVPAGILPENQRPGYQAPSPARGSFGANTSGGYTISRGMANVSSGNAYAFGNCTWYAYERRAQLGRPVGSFWGNAATWAMYARAAGITVNNAPAVGAVMQNGGGYGHVAIVEQVMSNGDIRISEMNYLGGGGGFNIVSGRTISAGQARSYNYIH